MKQPLYSAIYQALLALHNAQAPGFANPSAASHWRAVLDDIATNRLPRGAGFDCGTKIALDLVRSARGGYHLTTDFHHMGNESGMYDGWTEHTVHVYPSFLGGFDMKISGRDRNSIKDWIAQEFEHALREEVDLGELYMKAKEEVQA